MRKLLTIYSATIFAIFISTQAFAAFVYTKHSIFGQGSEGNKHALSGYDSVSYFTENKAVKGNKKYMFHYQDATWLFSSAKNRDVFMGNPQKYAPQYGGHCAWREAQDGVEVYGNPKIWTVRDNKLYLNYNKEVNNLWAKDIPGFIKKANTFWLAEFDSLN